MPHLLLILVLCSDPNGADAAKAVGEELARLGGSQVQVVIGADALAQLTKRGVAESDLVVSPAIPRHLTADDRDLVLIRIEKRVSAGDGVLESRVWSLGQLDSHVAIAGNGGDPVASAVSGILQVIGPRLPSTPGEAVSSEDGRLAQFAADRDWHQLVDLLVPLATKAPRQWYYQVLGQVRLGRRDDAAKSLAAFSQAHPNHFLIKAAEALLPEAHAQVEATPTPPATAPAPADDANGLRDAPAPPDDGGNTLK